MSSPRRFRPAVLALGCVVLPALALALAVPAAAQSKPFTFALSGGFGGAPEASEYGQASFQGLFAMDIAHRTYFEVRVGQLEIDPSEETVAGDLRYLTLTADYRLPADFYDSGLFVGLGFYDFTSDSGLFDENALGLTLGVLGDFRLTDSWSILAEASGHYADLDQTQFFLMAHVGLAFHF